MKRKKLFRAAMLAALLTAAATAQGIQFPFDIDNEPYGWSTGGAKGPEDIDWNGNGIYDGPPTPGPTTPRYVYKRFAASDGFTKMADGYDAFIFGYMDITGKPYVNTIPPGSPPNDVVSSSYGKAEFPAPTIDLNEGDYFYLNLVNAGMRLRPDLPDAHTIHWHGFPNAASIYDGEPMGSIGVNMPMISAANPTFPPNYTDLQPDLTYFYVAADPGTYLYHCHVEATEHMEMGMLGHLVVRPKQNGTPIVYNGKTYTNFAYNDCLAAGDPMCGSTGYDVEKIIMVADFDSAFHESDQLKYPVSTIPQPPFASFHANYFLLNGRGYPDTVTPVPIVNSASMYSSNSSLVAATSDGADYPAQKLDSLITINRSAGQRTALIRLTDLSIQDWTTIEIPGLPVKVVAKDGRLLRSPQGKDVSYAANSVRIPPGGTVDLIVDAGSVPAGTYYLFSRNLDHLNNDQQDRGGQMTQIVVQ